MAAAEDCATVLEQFVHDAANLPAEISHMMEEIQAKDTEMQKHQTSTNAKDGSIQKQIKTSGVLNAHPKESEYGDQVKKNYELCADLQSQKVLLAEKACLLFDRQLKRLDSRIRELQNDGQLVDGPPLPSIFNRKQEQSRPFMDPVAHMQPQPLRDINVNAHRLNQQVTASLQQAQSRQNPQVAAVNQAPQRSSAPATPAAALQQQQRREREHSAGAERRKKLANPLITANLPAQPSNLRQSSLGPGTPKAGTPTGTSASRAGSVPRASVAPQSATTGISKKSNLSKKVLSNQQVTKLKKNHTNHSRLSSAGRKKAGSPAVRGGRAGTAASEGDDSVLSSADASETDASQSRSRRGQKKRQVKEEADVEMVDEEEHDDEDADDDTRYCFCNERSYGEMVACENEECKYQWFHTGCLQMKKVPDEDEDWYCPACRDKPEIIEKMRLKMKKPGRK